MELVESYKSK